MGENPVDLEWISVVVVQGLVRHLESHTGPHCQVVGENDSGSFLVNSDDSSEPGSGNRGGT
jgi:hypothetical protein